MKVQWEYKTLKISTSRGFFSGTDLNSDELAGLLNSEGADGWELVSTVSIDMVNGGSKYLLAILKRPMDSK
ncbi:DUF4177 domain-containing protein [bacterium]|nr:DUF4177 domain-containing protein [bacterium]